MDIYVQKDGQRLGPFPETKIRQGIDTGEFAPADLAWTTGKASWQPLSALINLDVNQPPPISEPVPQEVAGNGSIEPPPFEAPSNSSQSKESLELVVLAIEDDSFSINGVLVPMPTDANPLNKFFGTPRWRERPPTYIWDDLGITAQGRDRKNLDYFSFNLCETKLLGGEYNPKQAFSGKLTIGGVLVTTETKIQDIVANKRGLPLAEHSTDAWDNGKRAFFGDSNPSISLYTTHQDTVSWLTFVYRRKGFWG